MDKLGSDFDLHGIVGIRLVGANAEEIAMIVRQLGPIQKPLNREPDITIEFVNQLDISGKIYLLGVDDAGFTNDAFLAMRGKHKSKIKVQIPFEGMGQVPCKIIAERGLSAVPLLIAIVNLTMISKGVLPLHASAFDYKGIGAIATGWAKGGKTETLLAFTAHGARYVGDEWVYLSSDGDAMYGIPEPIRLWDWHFDEMPQYRAVLKSSDRIKLKSLGMFTGLLEGISTAKAVRKTKPMKLLQRINAVLKRQLNVQVPPKRLFGETARPTVGTLQKIFFVMSHESPDYSVEKVEPELVAKRMVHSLQDEREELLAYYTRFRFAFPDKRNAFIDNLEQRQEEMLIAILKNKETYAVYHPYPTSIPGLYDLLHSYFPES
jgi:hypothetical protein